MTRALALAVFISGCTTAPGCFVGIALVPPSPFIVCGIDTAPADKAE